SEMTRYPDEKPVDHAPLTAEAGGNMRTQAGPGGDLVMVLKRGTEVEKVAEHGNYYLVVADDAKDPSKKLMGWIAQAAFNGDGPHRAPAEVGDGGVHHVDAGTKPVVVDAGTKPGPLRVLDIHKSADGSCAAGDAPCSPRCRAPCKTGSGCGPVPLGTCTRGPGPARRPPRSSPSSPGAARPRGPTTTAPARGVRIGSAASPWNEGASTFQRAVIGSASSEPPLARRLARATSRREPARRSHKGRPSWGESMTR